MCYHETLTFDTCSHKVKTISICPCYLRHESKLLGPPCTRRTGEGTAYLPYAKCRMLVTERYVVMALCPECNAEEKKRFGYSGRALGRSRYVEYELGRDAFYTEEGRDGMGERRGRRRGVGNGELSRRGFRGVNWRLDDGGFGRGREREREERYEGREERFKERHEERNGYEDKRYEMDRRYNGSEQRDQRYDQGEKLEERRHGRDERYSRGNNQYHDGNDRYEGHDLGERR